MTVPQARPDLSASRIDRRLAATSPIGGSVSRNGQAGSTVLAISLAVLVVSALSGCVTLGRVEAEPATERVTNTAAARSCYASQRMVEAAAEAYRAEKGALPENIAALVASHTSPAPQCPNGGEYSLVSIEDRRVCRCTVHGYYEDADRQ